MAPRDVDVPSSHPGIYKYPTNRDTIRHPEDWIKGKRNDDNVGKYWRIHNKLYDFGAYANKHPGGSDWLDMSRGLDITEAFETSHMVNPDLAERLLKDYYVGEAVGPRMSPFTFREDGFFKTLKRKASPILKEIGSKSTPGMLLMEDSLAALAVAFAILGASLNSWTCSIISGVILGTVLVGAHNFLHMRETRRRYYFDLGLVSSYEFRISHFFSHHLFPNTVLDFELVATPTYEFLPHKERSWWQKYMPILYSHALYAVAFWLDFIRRWYRIYMGCSKVRPENLIVVFQGLLLMLVAPNAQTGFLSWVIIHTTASFTFLEIGQNGQHHHPNIFHDGDEARDDHDFGFGQIDATRDRVETVFQNLFMVLVTFGNHTLHHLFPTVCHSKLPLLEDVFVETLHEFQEKWIKFPHWELYLGCYKQLARTERHKLEDSRKQINRTTITF